MGGMKRPQKNNSIVVLVFITIAAAFLCVKLVQIAAGIVDSIFIKGYISGSFIVLISRGDQYWPFVAAFGVFLLLLVAVSVLTTVSGIVLAFRNTFRDYKGRK